MPVGRPRDDRVDASVVDATRTLLLEGGLPAVTVAAVAARAGASKAAIYRRYPSKLHLVFAAAIHDVDVATPPDHGSLAADLTALLGDIAASLDNPVSRRVLPAMLLELDADDDVTERLSRTFVAREHEIIGEVLDRAVARGELPSKPDVAEVQAHLVGPVFAWIYVLRRPVDNAWLVRHAALLVRAWRPAAPTVTARPRAH